MTDQPDDTHDGNTKPLPLGSVPTEPTEPLGSDSLITAPIAQSPSAAPASRSTPRWLPWLLITAGVAALALLLAVVVPLLRDLSTAPPSPSVTPTLVTPSTTPTEEEQEQPQEEPPAEEPVVPLPEPSLPVPEPSEEPSTEPTPEEPAT